MQQACFVSRLVIDFSIHILHLVMLLGKPVRGTSLATVARRSAFLMLQVTPEQLMSTAPDPIAAFSSHVVQHMNQDHADSLTAMVKHFTGLTVDHTLLVNLDRFGMDCICMKDRGRLKCRLPFTR